MRRGLRIVFGCAWMFVASLGLSADEEFSRPAKSSAEFSSSYQAARQTIESEPFLRGLSGPRLGSVSTDEMRELVKTIQQETPIADVEIGKAGTVYDVIIQPGHYQRPPGLVGTAGASVSERALTTYITAKIAQLLKKAKLSVLVVSADDYLKDDPKTVEYDGLSAVVFLSIHADGHAPPCKSGPSLGYGDTASMTDMHQIALALALALGYEYENFMADNFTANLSKYYMFRHIRTSGMKGILEVGELTCLESEQRILMAVDAIAGNVGRALRFIVARSK